jgi:hypothetical protein
MDEAQGIRLKKDGAPKKGDPAGSGTGPGTVRIRGCV